MDSNVAKIRNWNIVMENGICGWIHSGCYVRKNDYYCGHCYAHLSAHNYYDLKNDLNGFASLLYLPTHLESKPTELTVTLPTGVFLRRLLS